MEEKERYEYFFGTNTVKDNTNKEFLSYKRVIDTLNQQDKELSKLRASYQQVKEENQQLKQQLVEKEKQIKKYDEFCKFVGESLFDEDDELWGYKEFYFRKLEKLGYIEEKGGYYRPTFEFDKLVKSHLKSQSEKPLGQLTRDIDAELYNSMVINNEELKYTDIKLLLDKIAKKYGGENESICD